MEFSFRRGYRFECLKSECAYCCRGESMALSAKDFEKWKESGLLEKAGRLGSNPATPFLPYEIFFSGQCSFLKDNLCSVYGLRPVTCRLFPLTISFLPEGEMLVNLIRCAGVSEERGELINEAFVERQLREIEAEFLQAVKQNRIEAHSKLMPFFTPEDFTDFGSKRLFVQSLYGLFQLADGDFFSRIQRVCELARERLGSRIKKGAVFKQDEVKEIVSELKQICRATKKSSPRIETEAEEVVGEYFYELVHRVDLGGFFMGMPLSAMLLALEEFSFALREKVEEYSGGKISSAGVQAAIHELDSTLALSKISAEVMQLLSLEISRIKPEKLAQALDELEQQLEVLRAAPRDAAGERILPMEQMERIESLIFSLGGAAPYKSEEYLKARASYHRRLNEIEAKRVPSEWEAQFMKHFSCRQCGRCCRSTFGATLRATWEDVLRWREQKREDILRHAYVFENLGADLWVDAKTQERLYSCPFFETRNGRSLCRIHNTKPKICREFPLAWEKFECSLCPVREEDKQSYCSICAKRVCGSCGAYVPREHKDFCPSCRFPLKVRPWAAKKCPATRKALRKFMRTSACLQAAQGGNENAQL